MLEGAEMTSNSALPPKPPKEPMRTTSLRAPVRVLDEVAALAKERGYSPNETMWKSMEAGLTVLRGDAVSPVELQALSDELLEQLAELRAEVASLKAAAAKRAK